MTFEDSAEAVDFAHNASFVPVTQQFNTTASMGSLTLNTLQSFAQFEREIAGECIRDKIAASKRKGMWMSGNVIFLESRPWAVGISREFRTENGSPLTGSSADKSIFVSPSRLRVRVISMRDGR